LAPVLRRAQQGTAPKSPEKKRAATLVELRYTVNRSQVSQPLCEAEIRRQKACDSFPVYREG
jgi:hypothetical protein